ncbi:MAG: GspE/PulE family protein [Verrucomicrobiota bacterium]|nr:type II secretion system protein E [Opitutales bacterium]MEC7401591.1 GspE/PulE family protein [Verrucomicrobiota bacterium]MEC8655396.1 GspE/PulE family protein [Verrucomicrobiota bacterium]MEC8790223.1 GspE/PulE family protein [Verrucomicrobiota bacterium]MEE3062328.1 GspE/PulE family protein [Verrucomicrobiota bacterium]
MNPTDEYLLEAFSQQGVVNEAMLAEIRQAVDAQSEEEVGDKDLSFMNLVLEKTGTHETDVVNFLASELNMESVDLAEVNPPEEILALLSPEWARQYEAFPLGVSGAEIEIVFGNPLDEDGLDNLTHLLGKTINPKIAYRGAVLHAIDEAYGTAEDRRMNEFFDGMDASEIEIGDGVKPEDVSEEDAPIIKYVHSVIKDALEMRASDIHMEPLEKKFRIRFRVDGKLQEQPDPPKRLQPSIISRTKLMANVSLAEKRVPLDGRINVKVGSKVIDLRVSTLPTVHGESIVMRILDKESLSLGLPQLGFFTDDQEIFEGVITLPDGIFLVTGPTGSGKSTTLYSALNAINQPDRKIITVEDPVEYEVAGINQVQVRADVGMTFSAALRAMLRQAPNIVMVGEIRDLETAEIAINASLTGHMVFSTLHTNDAPSAVSRLVDMGVKPFLVSASLRAALAQRLVRSICQSCKEPHTPSPSELSVLGIGEDQVSNASFMRGAGCEKCGDKGFRGRKGVFEIFVVNEEIEEMIYHNVSIVELRRKAREMGMRSMREDGFRKVLAGVTTLDEVLMVTTEEE